MEKHLLATLLCSASLGLAQSPGPFTQGMIQRYEAARLNTIEAAEFMPAGDFQYRLSPRQRMYSEWFGHTTVMNYRMCAAIKGEAPPDVQEPPGAAPKDQLIGALKRSFAYCDEAYQRMNDQKAWQEIEMKGRKSYPGDTMVNHVVALNEHYGNLVGYLRTKGITPPTTARREKKK